MYVSSRQLTTVQLMHPAPLPTFSETAAHSVIAAMHTCTRAADDLCHTTCAFHLAMQSHSQAAVKTAQHSHSSTRMPHTPPPQHALWSPISTANGICTMTQHHAAQWALSSWQFVGQHSPSSVWRAQPLRRCVPCQQHPQPCAARCGWQTASGTADSSSAG
jgi:hypothetical protein